MNQRLLSRPRRVDGGLLLSILVAFISASAQSQSLSIVSVDSSDFPFLRAQFYAYDVDSNVLSLTQDQVSIFENGIRRTVISVTCPQEQVVPLSSVLTFDISGSMASAPQEGGDGLSKITIARNAGQRWISKVAAPFECAVTEFSETATLVAAYSSDRNGLYTNLFYLAPVEGPHDGTNYQQGLLDPLAGGIAIAEQGHYGKKVLIFLTDGEPRDILDTAAVIARAKASGIAIYCVAVELTASEILKHIARETGGYVFENIRTNKAAQSVYSNILNLVQNRAPCTVVWKSAPDCQRSRHVSMQSNLGSDTANYLAPEGSVPTGTIAPTGITFGGVPPTTTSDASFTVSAAGDMVHVTGFSVSDPLFSVIPSDSFSLAPNQSRQLTLRFSPTDSSYHVGTVTVRSNSCTTAELNASGGYPGAHKPVQTLRVVSPNGGEKLFACTDSVIQWTGVLPTDSVYLEFSSNGGITWSIIVNRAAGLAYRWSIPDSLRSDSCLVRATLADSSAVLTRGWQWANSAGGAGVDYANAVGMDANGNVFVAGGFHSTANFGIGINDTSVSDSMDIFLAKYSAKNGVVSWVRRAGGAGDDYATALCVDHNGTVCVAGIFHGQTQIGDTMLVASGTTGMFVAKYDNSGKFLWARGGGGVIESKATGVAVDSNGIIYLAGAAKGTVHLGDATVNADDAGDIIVASLTPTGSMRWLRNLGHGTAGDVATDGAGDPIVVGTCSDSLLFPNGSVNVANQSAFAAKMTTSGNSTWIRLFPYSNLDHAEFLGVASDAYGNTFVSGDFSGRVVFGSDSINSNTGNSDMVLVKLDSAGLPVWVRHRGATSNATIGRRVSCDASGNVFVTGGGFNIGGLTTAYLSKYSPAGAPLFLLNGAGTGIAEAFDVAAGSNGRTAFAGTFTRTLTLGNTPLAGDANFNDDAFVAVLQDVNESALERDVSDALWHIVGPEMHTLSMIDFGSFCASAENDTLIACVTNTGTSAVHVNDIRIVGTDASHFQVVSPSVPFDVAPGDTGHVEFSYRPNGIGTHSAQAQFMTTCSSQAITLRGVGQTDQIGVSTVDIEFDTVVVGSHRDTTVGVILRNIGTGTLTLHGPLAHTSDTAEFIVQGLDSTITVAPNATIAMSARFKPLHDGPAELQVQFVYPGICSPTYITLRGYGKLSQPRIAVSSANAFAVEECGAHNEETSLIISNRGNAILVLSHADISGPQASSFALVAPILPISILPGSSQTFILRFAPTAPGQHAATLNVHSNSVADSVLPIALSGIVEVAGFEINPRVIDFGNVASDTTVRLTNHGGQTEIIRGSSAPPFTLATTRWAVSPFQPVDVSVHFDGATHDVVADTIVFKDSVCAGTDTLILRASPVAALQTTVSLPTLEANVGDEVSIPLTFTSTGSFPQGVGTTFTATISFDDRVLVPLQPISIGTSYQIAGRTQRVITITGARVGAELARFKCIGTLGDTDATPLRIDAFGWTPPGNVQVTKIDGSFLLKNICREGGSRFYNDSGSVAIAGFPNPFNPVTQLEISVQEKGRTRLAVMDVLGRERTVLLDADVAPGRYRFIFDATLLSTGVYYAVLTTPTQSARVSLTVSK